MSEVAIVIEAGTMLSSDDIVLIDWPDVSCHGGSPHKYTDCSEGEPPSPFYVCGNCGHVRHNGRQLPDGAWIEEGTAVDWVTTTSLGEDLL